MKTATAKRTDERALLRAAQAGDKAAFGHLVRRYHRLVAGVAYRMSGDAALADDVAQDAFLRAWQRLDDLRPERDGALRAWLCRIAHNRTVDALRRRPAEPLDEHRPDPSPPVQAHAERAEVRDAVQAALLRLPPHHRAVIVLREFEGLGYAEIADVLAIPVGTVMSRLHHARRRLADELAPFMDKELAR